MLRILAILFLYCTTPTSLYAQAWQWGKGSIGNNVRSWPVAADSLGNVYAAGVTNGIVSFDNYGLPFISNGTHIILAKYDTYGNFLWARSTQPCINSSLINITTDLAGNCYLLGCLADTGLTIGAFTLHNSLYPGAQYFIAKFDAQGNVIWANNTGGNSGVQQPTSITLSASSSARLMSAGGITTDASGNIFITLGFDLPDVTVGATILANKDPSGKTGDILLVKYDPSGNILWVHSSGGSGDDIPTGIAVTPAGDVYISGLFNSDSAVFGSSVIKNISSGIQRWNAFIARYDASGNPSWASGSGGDGKTYAAGIASDDVGNVYLVGGTADGVISFSGTNIPDTNAGSAMLYLAEFGPSNSVDWYKTIGSTVAGGSVCGYGVATLPGDFGSVWVTGAFNGPASIDTNTLNAPSGSVDPLFITGFDYRKKYIASASLKAGGSHQPGIACNAGSIYLCADYDEAASPFIIANDVLANAAANERWLYLAKYSFPGGNGPGSVHGPDTTHNHRNILICAYDSVALVVPPGYSLHTWNDGSSDTVLRVAGSGMYWVTSIGNGGAALDTFSVTIDSGLCNCNAALPTAFTPNGDGHDDTYFPLFEPSCVISNYVFFIYNRWGQCVFHSDNPAVRWDGRFKGVDAPLDVYMYELRYSTNSNYPPHIKKGDVTLVR